MHGREFQGLPPAGSRRRRAIPELEVKYAHEQAEAHNIRDNDDKITFQKAVDDPQADPRR